MYWIGLLYPVGHCVFLEQLFLKGEAGLVLFLSEKAGFSSSAARFTYHKSCAKLKHFGMQF